MIPLVIWADFNCAAVETGDSVKIFSRTTPELEITFLVIAIFFKTNCGNRDQWIALAPP
jgi:hypothetical protein